MNGGSVRAYGESSALSSLLYSKKRTVHRRGSYGCAAHWSWHCRRHRLETCACDTLKAATALEQEVEVVVILLQRGASGRRREEIHRDKGDEKRR